MREMSEQGQRNWETFFKIVMGLGVSGLIALSVNNNNATNSLHEAVNLNTYKLSQVQSSAQAVATLQQQVAQLQWEVTNLEQRQSKDDAFRDAHSGLKQWEHP
jgi:hypothetical protein